MTSSKLGIHVNNWSYEAEKFAECQPAVMKSIEHNADRLAHFKAISPGTLWIGRVVLEGFDGHADFANPSVAAKMVRGLVLTGIKGCRYDVLEGINEPIINDEEEAKRLCDFNIELSRLLQAEGFDFAAYSFGATRPDIKYASHLEPALYLADYLAMHAYGPAPLFHDEYWYLFNYRLFWNALDKEATDFLKGILLTEFGIAKGLLWTKDDKNSDVGWKDPRGPKVEPRHYGNDLIIADGQLNPYVKGAVIFQTGDLYGRWRTFEIKELFPGLEHHIRTFARQAPEIPKEEPKMKNPIKVGIRENYKVWNSPIIRIETMEMEEYLRRCVLYEVYASWKPEALKVQAVAARTFATWMKAHGKHPECHVCNSACCQVMGPATDPRTDKAVKDTESILITYQGEPIKAEYFNFCGGRTEDGGLPYQKSVSCQCWKIAPKDTVKAKHNRGMCQWGAEEMARRGKTYQEILNHYYSLEEPAPDWEAKYKGLREVVDEELDNLLEMLDRLDKAIDK